MKTKVWILGKEGDWCMIEINGAGLLEGILGTWSRGWTHDFNGMPTAVGCHRCMKLLQGGGAFSVTKPIIYRS